MAPGPLDFAVAASDFAFAVAAGVAAASGFLFAAASGFVFAMASGFIFAGFGIFAAVA